MCVKIFMSFFKRLKEKVVADYKEEKAFKQILNKKLKAERRRSIEKEMKKKIRRDIKAKFQQPKIQKASPTQPQKHFDPFFSNIIPSYNTLLSGNIGQQKVKQELTKKLKEKKPRKKMVIFY